jgi:O-antigen ligase/polysaccharide polymerase Wzy-like membrane protein
MSLDFKLNALGAGVFSHGATVAANIVTSAHIGRYVSMKLGYYHQVLIVVAVAIFYTNVPRYLYFNHDLVYLEAPKHWVLLFCLALLPLVLTRTRLLNGFKSPIAFWCFGFALLSVASFFLLQSDMAWQEVRYRFLAIIMIFSFSMIFWEPGAIRLARKTLVVCALIMVAFNIYELFVPLTFSRVVGRSAGLYEDPNLAGEALVLGMILSFTVLEHRYRAPFILLTGIGVLLTLSRASILAWLIAVTGILLAGRVHLKHVLLTGVGAFIVASVILLPRLDQLLMTWERTGVLNVNVVERLAWLTDPVGTSDHSSWERMYVAKQAWEKIADHPLLGSGTGTAYQQSEQYTATHNQYLSLMMDHGILGVMILPLFILAATWGAREESRTVAIVFASAVLILSLFTHSILYRPHAVILFCLMAAMAAMSRDRESQESVTTDDKGKTAEALVGA